MIYFAATLKQLRDAIDGLIEAVGEDAPVGTVDPPARRLDHDVTLEWVCINEDGRIVGTEADDYEQRLKPGEINAVAIR